MSKSILFERALNMKVKPTPAEKIFRDRLDLAGVKYKTQWVIGKYIVDFIIGKTIIELDGSSHDGREVYDSIRDSDLICAGYKVVRIRNSEAATFNFSGYANSKTQKSRFKEQFADYDHDAAMKERFAKGQVGKHNLKQINKRGNTIADFVKK